MKMDLEKATKVLKRFGWIWVILGSFMAVIGIVLLIGSQVAAADAERAVNAPMFLNAGIINLVAGIVEIDAGYYCFKAVNDKSKLKTVRNIAVICIAFSVITFISSSVRGTLAAHTVSSCLATAAVNVILLYAVNSVKKGSEEL